MSSGAIEPATDGILIAIDDTASASEGMTFCQGPHRHGVMRLLRAHTDVRRALAHRKCSLTLGAEQARHAAISSTTDQVCVEAALAVMRALRVRTVAWGELHDSLLMTT